MADESGAHLQDEDKPLAYQAAPFLRDVIDNESLRHLSRFLLGGHALIMFDDGSVLDNRVGSVMYPHRFSLRTIEVEARPGCERVDLILSKDYRITLSWGDVQRLLPKLLDATYVAKNWGDHGGD